MEVTIVDQAHYSPRPANPYLQTCIASPLQNDNNYYGSPVVSPGNWNVATPTSTVSMRGASEEHLNSSKTIQTSPSGSVPPTTPSSVSSNSVLSLPEELGKEALVEKNNLDLAREHLANRKAAILMQLTSNSDATHKGKKEAVTRSAQLGTAVILPPSPQRNNSPSCNSSVSSSSSGSSKQEQLPASLNLQLKSGLTARQAAAKRGEEKNRIKHEMKARYKEEKHVLKPAPRLATPPRKEKLATSTRKAKIAHDPIDDFETIDDFKCGLDFERQKEAEKTALRLIYQLPCLESAGMT